MPHIRMGELDTLPSAKPYPMQKHVLEEFLNEDPDMNDTIANLTQLLKHLETAPADTVSYNTLLHIRRSLYSLTSLQDLCVE